MDLEDEHILWYSLMKVLFQKRPLQRQNPEVSGMVGTPHRKILPEYLVGIPHRNTFDEID